MTRSYFLLAAMVMVLAAGTAGCGEKKTADESSIQLGLGPGEEAPYEARPMPDPVAEAEASPPVAASRAESLPPPPPPTPVREEVRPAPVDAAAPAAVQGRYTVQKGDTLIKIARRFYSDQTKWKDIWQANRSRIPNPDRIMPGLEIVLP